MKTIKDYIIERNEKTRMWLVTGDGRIEICVPHTVFSRGVTVSDVEEQLKDVSDATLIGYLNELGCGYSEDDFEDRDDIIGTFLDAYDEYWEEGGIAND